MSLFVAKATELYVVYVPANRNRQLNGNMKFILVCSNRHTIYEILFVKNVRYITFKQTFSKTLFIFCCKETITILDDGRSSLNKGLTHIKYTQENYKRYIKNFKFKVFIIQSIR